MTEFVTIPSEGWTLHGIVHLPDPVARERFGVVLLHENINTKFGTHRLYRQLAEALADAGFYALRFDNRGTNDSPGLCHLSFPHRVADARAAIAFFRSRYQLAKLTGWGLCMGAAVAVHSVSTALLAEEKLDGLVLCNILAHPADASLPQFGYNRIDLPSLAREMFLDGNLLRKLWHAPRKTNIYRRSLPRLASVLMMRYRDRVPELDRLRAAVGQVGGLLAGYPGPCLMIFGEKDTYRTSFFERVNLRDRLGLARKKNPPAWATVKGGDHTFASAEQTQEMIRYTVEWLKSFREGLPSSSGNFSGEDRGIPAAQVAN